MPQKRLTTNGNVFRRKMCIRDSSKLCSDKQKWGAAYLPFLHSNFSGILSDPISSDTSGSTA